MKVNQPECSSSITRRNLEILLLREKKVPMTTIGKMYGISRERVRQILEKKVKSMIKQPTDKEKLILLFQEYIALDNAITTFMDQRKKKLKMELMSRLECIKYQINALMQSEYPNLPNDFDVPTLQKYLQDI